jgi:hypothetical protein
MRHPQSLLPFDEFIDVMNADCFGRFPVDPLEENANVTGIVTAVLEPGLRRRQYRSYPEISCSGNMYHLREWLVECTSTTHFGGFTPAFSGST